MLFPDQGVRIRSERAAQRTVAFALVALVVLAFGVAGSGLVAAIR